MSRRIFKVMASNRMDSKAEGGDPGETENLQGGCAKLRLLLRLGSSRSCLRCRDSRCVLPRLRRGGSTLFYHADIARLMTVKWLQMQAKNTDMKRKVPSGWDSGRNDQSPR
ncbi:hypothetical protein ACVIKP_002329 [Rhizobium leguminosarum]